MKKEEQRQRVASPKETAAVGARVEPKGGTNKFHAWLAAANWPRSASEWRIEPVVCSSPTMNDSRPVKMDAADQAGFHEPGWKLENCSAAGQLPGERGWCIENWTGVAEPE